jgi:hypothetical protein
MAKKGIRRPLAESKDLPLFNFHFSNLQMPFALEIS